MHLKITKPTVGLVNITLDDRRGMTGMRIYQKAVEVETMAGTVGALLKEWRDKRDAIQKAKKGSVA